VQSACRAGALLIAAISVGLSAMIVYWMPSAAPYRPDYSVFWTAAHVALSAPSKLYDANYLTAAQSWLVDPARGPRPWPYPPSALPVFMPFALLPFWVSLVAWFSVSLFAFVAAARKFVGGWRLLIAVLAPPTIMGLVSGQTALLAASAILFAAYDLPRSPFGAGFLLGVAAAFKPTAVLAAPIVLAGNSKAMLGFGCGLLLLIAISLPLGPSLWLSWAWSMPQFSVSLRALNLMPAAITPLGFAAWLGLGQWASIALQVAGVVAGAWLAYRCRGGDPQTIAIGIGAGSILCSPYAMPHDLTVLMPFAAAGLAACTPIGMLRSVTMFIYPPSLAAPMIAWSFAANRESALQTTSPLPSL
jgi:hypothetical protein